MIIDYIRLEDFLSHKDTTVNFENGVNIIYGKNGAGKSSIVDAIRFALFGEKRGDKISELIRSRAQECSVTVGFKLNENYYEVFRSLGLAKSGNITRRDSWLKKNGEMVAETAEGVTREIQNGLGIPKEIFLNSVFVRQGEMDALISETPANRERMFSRIIGIDILSENAQKLKNIRYDLKLEEARFSDLEERVTAREEELRSASREAGNGRETLETSIKAEKELSGEVDRLERSREEALRRKTQYESLKARISEIESRLRRTREEIAARESEAARISFSRKEKEDLENDPILKGRSAIGRYMNGLASLKSVNESISTVKKAIEDYERDRARLAELDQSHSRYESIRSEIESISKDVQALHSVRALSESLGEELAKDKRRIGDLSSFLSGLPESMRMLNREQLSEERTRLERTLREAEGRKTALKERMGTINSALSELRKSKGMLGDNHRCPVCGTELDEDHLAEIHEKYRKDEEKLMNDSATVAEQASAAAIQFSEAEAKLSGLSGSQVEEALAASEERSRLASAVEEKGARLSEMKGKLEALGKAEESQRKLQEELDGLQSKEKEHSSLEFAIKRVPLEKYREKKEGYENEKEKIAHSLEMIEKELGFVPDESSLERAEALEEKLESARKAEAEYSRLRTTLEGLSSNARELETEMGEKKKEAGSMGDVVSVLNESSQSLNEKKQSLLEVRERLSALRERISAAEKRAEDLRAEIQNLETDRSRFARVKEAGLKLEKLREAFDRNGIQSLIRKDSSVSINNMTRNYLSSFNFEFDDVRIDENFDIKVINNGVEEPLDSLSGGERISLAIAVRLAIARYLTGRVSTVIMDEPTNYLDEDRRSNLKDIIQYSLRDENMVQQMIMITHHAELTSAADSSFEVTKKGGISTVEAG